MKVLLLCAGRSRRFWPLNEKSFFPVCGKALLEHQVGRLQAAGCTDIILVGGAHNLEIAHGLFPEIPTIEQENLDLGMQGALLSALPRLGSEPVMIVSGNDVIEPAGFEDLKSAALRPGAQGALLARRVARYFPGGYLQLENERIISIVEKPGEGQEPSNLINIVMCIHNDASVLLKTLQTIQNARDDGYERALDVLFKTHTYIAVPYENYWQPVKYPWHLLSLLPHLLEEIQSPNIHPSAQIHPSAVVEGNVILEEGVRIFPHATVRGPCFIGRGSMIGNNSLVWGSSIGPSCVIGFGTEVKASVLGGHVWTHSTYIGDSVIGENVAFGAGCVTGNFRLDEGEISSVVGDNRISTGLRKFGTAVGSNCRIGIHVSINPGVKIGKGSFVSTSSVVTKDIPEESFVTMKNGEMDVRKNISLSPHPENREAFRKNVEKK